MIDRQQAFKFARQSGFVDWTDDGDWQGTDCDLERLVNLVAAYEREECAKLCAELVNEENSDDYRNAADWCATRIRARGQ